MSEPIKQEKRERRMRAYYYEFSETGIDAIDDFLEQIAIAGKKYHHTDSWADPDEYDENKSCVDRIQEAAAKAAEAHKALHTQITHLRKLCEGIKDNLGKAITHDHAMAAEHLAWMVRDYYEPLKAALQTTGET